MSKYTFIVSLGVSVEFLDSTNVLELETITKNKIRILIDGENGIKVRYLNVALIQN